MVDCNEAVRSFRFRLATIFMLRYGLAAMTGWTILWGTAVLILRAGFGLDTTHLLWGLAGFPLMLIPAALLTHRRMPTETAVRALIDHQGQVGGLLMAGAEVPLGNWNLPSPSSPAIHWQGGKSWAQFGAAAVYALVSFLVPQAAFQQVQGSTFHIDREVEQIARQIDVLKENAILEAERAQQLKDKLDQVKKDATGNEPAKTLDALDHLQETAKQEAAKAAEKAAQHADRLQKTKTLADAINQAGDQLDPKLMTLAMKELGEMMENLQKENQLSRELDKRGPLSKEQLEKLAQAAKDSKLSKEDLEKLAQALKDAKGDVGKMLENLREAKLISAEMLKECKGCMGGEDKDKEAAAALAKYLKENGGQDAKGLKQAIAQCNRPGQGGVTRGRGDANLTFGNESKKDGAKFKEQILPPAALAALKDSQLGGISSTAPKVDPGGPSSSGALDNASSGGGSANTQVILPRHRDAVRTYFERPDKSPK